VLTHVIYACRNNNKTVKWISFNYKLLKLVYNVNKNCYSDIVCVCACMCVCRLLTNDLNMYKYETMSSSGCKSSLFLCCVSLVNVKYITSVHNNSDTFTRLHV